MAPWTTFLAISLGLSLGACTPAGEHSAPAAAAAAPVATSGTTPASGTASPPDAAARTANTPVAVTFRNVHMHVAEGVVLEIRALEGALISNTPGRPSIFDDQQSFTLRVDRGEVAMTPASLTRLLNDHVFAYEHAPITGLEVTIEDGHLKQKGTLHKGVPLPFTILADVSATPDGKVRLHPVKIDAAGVRAGGLMKMFGLELDDLVKSNRAHGVEIDDNDFLLAPDRLLPEPPLQGRLRSVRIERDRIVETFGSGKAEAPRVDGASNYMSYRGGMLRFGKLTMTDVDLRLIDADQRDPFDFYPRHYVAQLVAGYSKNTERGGLRVYMPDYDEAATKQLTPAAVLH